MARVALVHPNERAKWSEAITWDGLHAALEIVGDKHEVKWFLENERPDDSYDWIIPWGVGSEPFNNTIEHYSARKALLCAGHPHDTKNFEKFEAIFVESPAVAKKILHPKVVVAFGTDTQFFKPRSEEKLFDVFFPGTFSPWKRQDLLVEAAKGLRLLTCGVVQPDGQNLALQCQNNGYCLQGLVPTRIVAKLYNMSRVVVIPAWHGSERTALEAMSSNIPLVIALDNETACSLAAENVFVANPDPDSLRESIDLALRSDVGTRDHVLNNYSEKIYAEKILEVIES